MFALLVSLALQAADGAPLTPATLVYGLAAVFGVPIVLALVLYLARACRRIDQLYTALCGIEGAEPGALKRTDERIGAVEAALREHKHDTNDRLQPMEIQLARCVEDLEDRRVAERRSVEERRQGDRRHGGEA